MSHCTRFNSHWMSKDQYKAWLTSLPENNTKAIGKLCAKTVSLFNIGQQALKSHAAGKKKHIIFVTQTHKTDSVTGFFTHKTDSVTGFFTVKCGVKPGASSSASLGKPSTPLVCDTEDTKIQEEWQHT